MEEIHSYFYLPNVRHLTYQIGLEYFRDINLYFVFDENVPPGRTSAQKWYTTNIDFFNEASCAKATDPSFIEADFAKKYYNDDRKGDRVIGTYAQRLNLGSKKYLMPITWIFGSLRIIPNESFYTSNTIEFRTSTFLKDPNIKNLGEIELTEDDRVEIRKLIPNFRLYKLHKYVCEKNGTNRWQNEIMFYPQTRYQSFGQPEYNASLMKAQPDKVSFKYRHYLDSDRNIFHRPYFRKILSTLAAAEGLFDKDVLEIKDLVKKTKDFVEEVTDEQKNFILHDNSDVIQETFSRKLKKM